MFEMTLQDLIAAGEFVLTEGSIYELLRRNPSVELDPDVAHAALIYDPPAAEFLKNIHRAYLEIAVRHGLPALAFTDTWRANQERIDRSRFRGLPVNEDNAQLLCDIRDQCDTPVFVGGLIGCKGDAYKPAEALSSDDARAFHRPQIDSLVNGQVDFLFAATLPSLSEAKGIAMAMAETEVPYTISFVVRPQGTLLDGTPVDQMVDELDAAVTRPPLGYYVNCVHPQVVLQACDSGMANSLRTRFIGLQANSSPLSPEELNGMVELQTETPARLATLILEAARRCRLSILGGCCGTDTTHMEHLASKLEN